MNKQEEQEFRTAFFNLEQRVKQLELKIFPAVVTRESIKTEYPNRVPTYKEDAE